MPRLCKTHIHIFGLILLSIILFVGQKAIAAETESSEPIAGPGIAIVYDVINFALFVALILIFAPKKVRAYFTQRAALFREARVRAENIKKDAESQKRSMQDRLDQLEASSQGSLEKARADAELLKQRMLAEAETLQRALEEDATRVIAMELERAKAELRSEMIQGALMAAKKTLSEKMLDQDQTRLQSEFVEKIKVVET